jgi:hypothetical protein
LIAIVITQGYEPTSRLRLYRSFLGLSSTDPRHLPARRQEARLSKSTDIERIGAGCFKRGGSGLREVHGVMQHST